MPLPITRRPPTLLERVLGRRRARLVRRRLGLAAVGVGVSLLRPRRHVVAVTAMTAACVALLGVVRLT